MIIMITITVTTIIMIITTIITSDAFACFSPVPWQSDTTCTFQATGAAKPALARSSAFELHFVLISTIFACFYLEVWRACRFSLKTKTCNDRQ
jgi:nitrate reductase gamma subunit